MSGRATIRASRGERAGAVAAVMAITGGVGWLLASALALHVPRVVTSALVSFDVVPPPPPPPPPPPDRPPPPPSHTTTRPRDAAAPPAKRAVPTPVVAPTPIIVLPVPPLVVTAPLPGSGAAASAGASDRGTGTGAGGQGNGRGGGGDGDGGQEVRLLRRLNRGELPPAARRLEGVWTVYMHWIVGVDGRVHDCTIARSSGDADLDVQTCALIAKRLRYAPAHDRAGRAFPVEVDGEQRWEVAHDRDGSGEDDGQ